MKLSRQIFNIHYFWRQYKREMDLAAISQFNLNDLIKWLGNRQSIEVDGDLIF